MHIAVLNIWVILPSRDVPTGENRGHDVPNVLRNFKKIGHVAGNLALVGKFDQI